MAPRVERGTGVRHGPRGRAVRFLCAEVVEQGAQQQGAARASQRTQSSTQAGVAASMSERTSSPPRSRSAGRGCGCAPGWASACARPADGGSMSYWLRSVATRRTGSASIRRAASTSQRREGSSAQWTSSTASSSGASAAWERSRLHRCSAYDQWCGLSSKTSGNSLVPASSSPPDDRSWRTAANSPASPSGEPRGPQHPAVPGPPPAR